MRTIIHDLNDISFLKIKDDDYIVNNIDNKSCIGCFNCWVKTPFKCIFNDKIKENGKKLLESDELIIISKCINGSYSSTVKKILERSISYVRPFFTLRNNEIHHINRIDKRIDFKVYFYGNDLTDEEKNIATRLVKRNQTNLDTKNLNIYFLNSYKEVKI